MEVLFHFIFELIKISILACIYGSLIRLVAIIIGRHNPESWFSRVPNKKVSFWYLYTRIIFVCLFCFMFTHYGDHGLGDHARIPISHWREIEQINGNQAYIQAKAIDALDIDKFIITDDYVYGLMSSTNQNYEGNYFIYDLVNNKVRTFKQEKDYIKFLTTKINITSDYQDFNHHYTNYWHGLRFWILP